MENAQHHDCWRCARAVLRRKSNPDSILAAMRTLKCVLVEEADGTNTFGASAAALRTIITAVNQMVDCETDAELEAAFALFVNKAEHMDMDDPSIRTAVKKTYAVYAFVKQLCIARAKRAARLARPGAAPCA
jgi:uncharacterized protein (DUF924 family)